MDPPSKKDQIYLLMFEPGMAELLYVLLTKKEYSAELKEKILKVSFRHFSITPCVYNFFYYFERCTLFEVKFFSTNEF